MKSKKSSPPVSGKSRKLSTAVMNTPLPETTRLANGVVVVTESLPGIRSGSLGVFLDIGSRDENPATNGLAHLFEHMVFKGTPKRNALNLVQGFERSGGQINAYTSKEQTCVYAKVVDSEVNKGLTSIHEMLLQSHFDNGELRKEKEVIVEEIRGAADNPEDYVYDLFGQAYYGDHALGYPIAGSEKSVRGLGRDHLLAHQEKVKGHWPVVVSAVGALAHEEVVGVVSKAFKSKPAKADAIPPARQQNREDAPVSRRHLVEKRKVQQVNVMLGGPGYDGRHPKKHALILLNSVFGDGMSSRLFQSVREELGLVYTVYSSPEFMHGGGNFTIAFGSDPRNWGKALAEVGRQIRRLKREGITEEELRFAKDNVRGSVLLGLESTQSRMGALARRYLTGDGHDTVAENLKRLSRVTLKDVNESVAYVFQRKLWASAVIAPQGVKVDVAKELRF
jgi:predicted Zn-dependent peptidase